jgi:hypothetical protein
MYHQPPTTRKENKIAPTLHKITIKERFDWINELIIARRLLTDE